MKTLLLLLTVSGLLAAGPADDIAVKAALDKFNAAAKAGDRATLEKLLHGDLRYAHSNAKIENKAECIQALVTTKPNFVLDPGLSIRVYGKSAVVQGRMTANVVQNGQPNKIPLDFIQVWVQEGASWLMVARHTARLQ
ncbi:MAG: nuclear transport factor 2 family protein [Bryobacterales bacterium]|nr:nuclear transport factor 2 family protein [Bryobacterales bacterium]